MVGGWQGTAGLALDGGTPASGVGGTRCRGGYTGGTRLLPEDPAPPVTLPLSLQPAQVPNLQGFSIY